MIDAEIPSLWHQIRGAGGRWRRQVRRRILEPILVGQRSFRETVLNALSDRGHLIYCEFPDGNFFVDPSDRVVGTNLVWRGEWQKEELLRTISALERANKLRPGQAFIDVGANIGTHTVYALKSGNFGRAIAFEPEPSNLKLLQRNAAANGYTAIVDARDVALSNAPGNATLHLHPRNKAAHAIGRRPSLDGLGSIDVRLARLEDELSALSPEQIGLVWIDVEGHESEVVEGLGRFIGQVPLAIEYAPYRYTIAQRTALDRLLLDNYGNFQKLDTAAEDERPIAEVASINGIVDIVVY